MLPPYFSQPFLLLALPGHNPQSLLPDPGKDTNTLPFRSSAAERLVGVVTLWTLPAPKYPGLCLQGRSGGALASEHSRLLSNLGPIAGFRAVSPPPLSGP